jgi:hypothetical protein
MHAGEDEPAARGVEQPVERLGAGGIRRPLGITLGIAAAIAVLVWQPWTPPRPPSPPGPPVATRPVVSPLALATPPSTAGPGPSAAPTPVPQRAPDGTLIYASLVDNEWTVVALLVPPAAASSEEPALQHPSPAPWPPAGPLLVLQQGVLPVSVPIGGTRHPDLACQSSAVPRDRTAVPLPAGRVAYLGVTFPGMDPLALVAASVRGPGHPAGIAFDRVRNVVVPLAGLALGQRYTVPSTGIGGAVLFAMTPAGILPPGTYRFEVTGPGNGSRRFLYACVGP